MINKVIKFFVRYPITLLIVLTLMFYFQFFVSGKLIYGQDIIGLNLPIIKFAIDSLKSGQLPLWNPYGASGYPFLPGSPVFYPPNIIFLLLPLDWAFSLSQIIHTLVGLIGMYALCRYLGSSKFSSIVAALSFGFGGFYIARMFAGHYMLIQSVSWYPLFLLNLDSLLSKPSFKKVVLLGLLFSLILLPGHPQPFIYAVVFWLIYPALYLLINRGLKRSVGLYLGTSLLICFLLSSVYLLPTVEGIINSQRGKISWEAATLGSFSPKQLVNFVLPDFYGNPATNNYHGGALYNEVAVYIGLLSFLFATWSLRRIKDKKILMLVLTAAVFFFLAIGKNNPVYRLLYQYIPGFTNARIPARLMWWVIVIMPILASFGVDDFINFWPRVRSWLSIRIKRLKDFDESKLKIAILTLVVIDLFTWGSKSLLYTNSGYFFEETELVKKLKSESDAYFRNFFLGDNTLHDLGSVYRIFEIQSDTSLITGVYGKLLEKFSVRDPLLDQARERAIVRTNNSRLLEMLNVRYVIPEGGFEDTEKLKKVGDYSHPWFSHFDKRFPTRVDQKTPVYQTNPNLKRFFLTHKAKVVNETELFDILTNEKRNEDLNNTAYFHNLDSQLEKDVLAISGKDNEADKVTVNQYKNNEINLSTTVSSNGFLVFNEIYYPGWKAYIDGSETKIYQTDFAFRSIFVPEGDHRIRMVYEPNSFRVGAYLSLFSTVLLVLYFALRFRRTRNATS